MSGRRYDLALSFLDRQLVDRDGDHSGKVDDIRFEWPEGGAPYVSKILTGPGALAGRIGGRAGRALAGLHRRLKGEGDPGPVEISFGIVSRVDESIYLTVARGDLGLTALEEWLDAHLIDKIPGAGHAPE